MKLKLSAGTIYWGAVFTSSSKHKSLYRKLKKQNHYSPFREMLIFIPFIKDTRTIDLTNDELQNLIKSLELGTQSYYIDHADSCEEALKDIKQVTNRNIQ